MKKRKNGKLAIFIISLIILSLACSVSFEGEDAPVVVIVLPGEGETVTLGQLVNVVSTTTSNTGLLKVDLLVNGQVIASDSLSGAPKNHNSNFSWIPSAEGAVVLGVVGYDTAGNASEAALRTVQVVAGGGGDPGSDPSEQATVPPTEQTVMCTPPACGANESYFCAGSCPGGCGITCATFTPTNPPPNTPTFTPHPPTKTLTPTNTSVWVPSIQFVVSLQVIQLTSVETVYETVNIASGQIGYTTATCPSGSQVVSGGFAGHRDIVFYTHSTDGNGWRVYGKNYAASSKQMTVFARCLTNTSGTTSQVHKVDHVPAGAIQNIKKACPAGSIVTGGGWASQSSGDVTIYNSSKDGNRWQVWVKNNAGSSKQVNVYAVCLSGVNATTYKKDKTITIPANSSNGGFNACDNNNLAVGGGFAGQNYFKVYNSSPRTTTTTEWAGYAVNPGGSSQNFHIYAVCLKFN
ncbi:MAG: Ig-like domain-containing protein [Chloroflexota bacterium]